MVVATVPIVMCWLDNKKEFIVVRHGRGDRSLVMIHNGIASKAPFTGVNIGARIELRNDDIYSVEEYQLQSAMFIDGAMANNTRHDERKISKRTYPITYF